MSGASVAHLKFRLGLLTSRFRANHPLKACPACMTKDLDDHQTTYWRLDHQFPGVWHCPVHGEDYAAKAIRRASEIFSVPSGSVRAIAEIGRSSCRESVWRYVSLSVVAVSLKKK